MNNTYNLLLTCLNFVNKKWYTYIKDKYFVLMTYYVGLKAQIK